MKTSYETADYAAMMDRMLTAWARRVADGDPDDLTTFLSAQGRMETLAREAIAAHRSAYSTSWTVIGRAAGMTRQAAQQRWGTR